MEHINTDDAVEPIETEGKTFTQQELDKIVQDRLAREREKYADYNEIKEKAQIADSLTSELTTAQQIAAEAQTALLRHVVASEKGVPANMLTGSSREDLEAHADTLLSWKGAVSAPTRNVGQSGSASTPATASKKELAAQSLKNMFQ